jgi:hypothetical protein
MRRGGGSYSIDEDREVVCRQVSVMMDFGYRCRRSNRKSGKTKPRTSDYSQAALKAKPIRATEL